MSIHNAFQRKDLQRLDSHMNCAELCGHLKRPMFYLFICTCGKYPETKVWPRIGLTAPSKLEGAAAPNFSSTFLNHI